MSRKEIVLTILNLALTMPIWSWKSFQRGLWHPLMPWKIGIPSDTLGTCIVKLCGIPVNVCVL